jgi:hypothetical protein
MPAARLIVRERSSRWVIPLRWSLKGTNIRADRYSDWEACFRELNLAPSSVVLAELAERIPVPWARVLANLSDRFPSACWIALGEPADAEAMWLARELGAVHTLTSTRDLTATVNLIRRHLLRVSKSTGNAREQIWERLPLGERT